MHRTNCPHCIVPVSYRPEMAGTPAHCPKCSSPFTLPVPVAQVVQVVPQAMPAAAPAEIPPKLEWWQVRSSFWLKLLGVIVAGGLGSFVLTKAWNDNMREARQREHQRQLQEERNDAARRDAIIKELRGY